MKSVCLIASTLLIVLISQHTTNGLPIDNLTTEFPCSKGFEFVDGKCQPTVIEQGTVHKDEPRRDGACPEGQLHSKHGICEEIKSEDLLATTYKPEEHESKSFHDKDEHETKSFEDSTDLSDTKEKSGDLDIPKGCPPGTKPDEQGACQDEVESSSKKPTLDFKDLLTANGTCPDGMEMLKNKCVYVKSKQTSKIDPMFDLTDDETKFKVNEAELVPLLPNNVCPLGTDYYSNGLCRKRTRTLGTTIVHPSDKLCRFDEVLVDGKCTRKELVSPVPSDIKLKDGKSDKTIDEKITKRAVPW